MSQSMNATNAHMESMRLQNDFIIRPNKAVIWETTSNNTFVSLFLFPILFLFPTPYVKIWSRKHRGIKMILTQDKKRTFTEQN